MNRRTTLFFLLGVSQLFNPAIGQVKNKSSLKLSKSVLLNLINIGSRQSMLIERMAKYYAQINLGVLSERASKTLQSSVLQFEQNQKTLLQLAPTAEIKKNYESLSGFWSSYKVLLKSPPNIEEGRKIYQQSEVMTNFANEGVESIDNFLGINTGALVSLSGHQRMLTQRLAKNVFFKEWLQLKDNSALIASDESAYEIAARNLTNDLETTASIKLNLSWAATQWLFFQAAIQTSLKERPSKNHLIDISNTSERMLEVYESVTLQFQTGAVS